MSVLDVGELQAFALVAQTGSFGAAGRRLFLSQPAVSRRIARLERVLGVRLLDRSSRRVTLTPQGAAVFAEALLLLTSHRKLLAAVATADETQVLPDQDLRTPTERKLL